MMMGRKLKSEDKKECTIKNQYNLLPIKILDIIGMKEESEISSGKQVDTDAAVLTVNTKSFLELVQENPDEIFWKVNQVLNQLIPIVSKSQGVIDRFVGGGLCAFYLENYQSALQAVLEIREHINEETPYTAGISYGPVKMGIVGNEDAFSTAVISEYTGLSEFLQCIAQSYYAKALMSESFTKQIEGFREEYENRFLGYLYIKSISKIEKIYDLFALDEQEVRWLKRKTCVMFEEGVCFFADGNYDMARKHFVEVLKVNRNDGAARKYLYLCEQCLEEKVKGEIYFECC